MLSLRPMMEEDLPLVDRWLHEPHVARWWTPNLASERMQAVLHEEQLEAAEAQIALYLRRVHGEDMATIMLIVEVAGAPVGWCQWYRWADYPAEARAVEASDGEAGIDYAIGEPTMTGMGLGTHLIGDLVQEVRRHVPGAGVLVTPDAANVASRRVLEKNGFLLVGVRPVATEPTDAPMAIYRLPSSH